MTAGQPLGGPTEMGSRVEGSVVWRRVSTRMAMACVREALCIAGRDRGTGVAAGVVDDAGELVAFLRADDAPLRAMRLAVMKAHTAARFGRSTAALADVLAASGRPLVEYGDSRYTALPGGVPLVVGGCTVGGLGISGRDPAEDHALACAAVSAVRENGGGVALGGCEPADIPGNPLG